MNLRFFECANESPKVPWHNSHRVIPKLSNCCLSLARTLFHLSVLFPIAVSVNERLHAHSD